MFSPRTDLAMETPNINDAGGIFVEEENEQGIETTRVYIKNEEGAAAAKKPVGNYVTLHASALPDNDIEQRELVASFIAREISALKPYGDYNTLVIGLGNRAITPDSLGPRVTDKLLVTRHLMAEMPEKIDSRLKSVSALAPGVLGITGIETGEIVRGITEKISPGLIIAIDSLAARSMSRLCTTVQITDTGIMPGSGLGGRRHEISRRTIGIPVIAVGVPMVVYASSIINDAIEMLSAQKNFSALLDNRPVAVDVLGSETEKLLNEASYDMIVTPKEIDKCIEGAVQAVSGGINMALHPGVTLEEFSSTLF